MRALINHSLTRPALILASVLAIIVFGLSALSRIPFDAFPDLSGTRVDVIATAPGMSPEDVEQLVTFPIESSLMGIEGAQQVRSVSKFALSLVTVPFPDNVDVYFARTLVQQRLNDVKSALPPGAEVSLGPVSSPMGELYQYVLTSDSMSLTELKTLQDYTIRPRLRTVAGVSEVNSWGGFTEQIHVIVDPVRLAARQLTVADVEEALAANNLMFGGSYVETGGERFTLRGMGRVGQMQDIASIVISSDDGVSVRVGDVAIVERGALPRQGAVTMDGTGEVVSGMVLKLKGADSRRVIAAVRERMAEIQKALPSHVKVTPFYDQSELVSRTTTTIARNLAEGGLLVIAVLFLFLRNIRASLIVASVIPLSMLAAFIAMNALGYSANLMSLGALDFGLIVDASVVMVENLVRRLEQNPHADRRSLFLNAAVEVGRPVLFGIAIIVAVYIPIFTLDGMEGRMFRPMAFTVVTAVLASLLLALTFVPAISSRLLQHVSEKPNKLLDAINVRYEKQLRWTLSNRKLVVGSATVVVIAAVTSLKWIGTEFMPKLDEGSILITTRRMPSVSLADATRLSLEAERIVKRFPEVITVVTKEGRPDLATEAMGLFEGDMYIILKPQSEWVNHKSTEDMVASLDSALTVVPGIEIAFTQPLAMRLDEAESGIRTDLGIKVVGADLEQNQRLAQRILSIVRGVDGNADASVEISDGSGQIAMDIKRDALAQYGLSVAEVQRALDLAIGSRTATELVDGPRRIGVVTRYPDAQRGDVTALRGMMIRSSAGALVPLERVATLTVTTGPELIGHEDGQRRALVLSNVRGRDLGGFVGEVRERVAREIDMPAGTFLEWGGQYENQQRAMGRLSLVVPASLLIIFCLLYGLFRSISQSLLVLTNVPFALVGGIAVLWVRNLNLNLSASIGFIALFGIAVLNGVVLVSHINALRAGGESLLESVRRGAGDRLRPVLMTALVASLGFVPMALSHSPGSEVQRPLASVVIGGLITSTLLTLFVLPSLYLALAEWQGARARARGSRVPAVADPVSI
jgi:cobalt-zinc-cadmium resistance protein CzcA